MEINAPKGVIDQIGECLSKNIHAFVEMDPTAKVFIMAKWDIKIKMDFGTWTAWRGKKGTLFMASHKKRANQSCWWFQHHYK